jgi:hypothetical protein
MPALEEKREDGALRREKLLFQTDIRGDFRQPIFRHLCVKEFCLEECTDTSGHKREEVLEQAVNFDEMT